MSGLQVLIPMSGQGTRYQKAGYNQPKPMIPVNGRPMIERLLEKFPTDWPCVFVLADNHQTTGMSELLLQLRPQAKIIYVPKHSEGPAFAIENAIPHLDPTKGVLVSYCDYGLKWDPWDFANFVQSTQCDTCLVSYRGFHAHYLSPVPYAYSRMQGERVVQVKEKGSFTSQRENEYASCGAYYFREVEAMKNALAFQKKNDLKLNGEYYTSLTVEALLKMDPQAQGRVYEIEAFYQWGTPQDLREFEYWERVFQSLNRSLVQPESRCSQILLPMAGLGSRIAEILKIPKPLVSIDGIPMYRKALESFPRADRNVFVTVQSIAEKVQVSSHERMIALKETPSGQALTTELGLAEIEDGKDFIVTACDHSVVLNNQVWKSFIAKPDCDAAIFTVRGFPGTTRKPQSFSYVQTASQEGAYFPLVQGISVKRPLTAEPSQEELLVGSFWFKNKQVALDGIRELKSRDLRVNGELYLDSIFILLIENGLKVRQIPLDGYINWGDAESLKESLYWYEVFMGHKMMPRPSYPGC